jgi:hypothetical protein
MWCPPRPVAGTQLVRRLTELDGPLRAFGIGPNDLSEEVLGVTLGVRYVSGLQRRLESRSWQKAGVSARQLAGGGSPVDGNFNHGPGGFRFGCTGGCTALKVAPYVSPTPTLQGVSVTGVGWV